MLLKLGRSPGSKTQHYKQKKTKIILIKFGRAKNIISGPAALICTSLLGKPLVALDAVVHEQV